MKIALDRIDSHGLVVDLADVKDASAATREHIAIRSATGLRGVLEQEADRLALSETTAEILVLDALHVLLGELVMSNAKGATLHGVTLALVQETSSLSLDASAGSVVTADLAITVDDVVLAFGATLTDAHLTVRDAEGSLTAERVEMHDFSLRVGDLQLAAGAVGGRAVAIRWGAQGFAMNAAGLAAPALDVTSGDLRLALTSVDIEAFTLDGPTVTARRATVGAGRLALALSTSSSAPAVAAPTAPTATTATTATAATRTPFFDWRALDGLSGEIDVDVEVDLTVPLIGHRKATHRLRAPIAGGALDYRALENNLSALENALIDFSVRDGRLCLERVNPLFPARGHGKPIVLWDLDAPDLALAERDRVRLAVLPSARMAEAASDVEPLDAREPREPAKKSSIALRRLALHRIDVKLALAPVQAALTGRLRLRSIGALVVQGSVDHAPDEAQRPGAVLGELSALAASLAGVPLGAGLLDVGNLELASASPIELTFVDIHPTKVQVDLTRLVLEDVKLRQA
jgi:hypothetical protein